MFILRTNLKIFLSKYKSFLLTIFFVISICLSVVIAGSKLLYSNQLIDDIQIAVCNYDGSYESKMILETLKDTKDIASLFTFVALDDEETAKTMLAAHTVAAVIIVPEHFIEDIKSGKNTPLSVLTSGGLKSELAKIFIQSSVGLLSISQAGIYSIYDLLQQQQMPELYEKVYLEANMMFISLALDRADLLVVQNVSAVGDRFAVDVLFYFAIHMFLFFSLMNTSFVSNCLFLSNWDVLSKITNSPISKTQLLFWNILSAFVIHFVFCSFIIGFVVVLNRSAVSISVYFVVAFCLFALALSAVSVFFALFVQDKNTRGAFIAMFSFAFYFVSGGLIPNAFLPEFFSFLSKLTINFYAFDAFKSLLTGSIYSWGSLISLFAFFAFLIAGSKLRLHFLFRR